MVLYMDEAVGELVSKLQDSGLWDNTLLVFVSDNGGPIYEPGRRIIILFVEENTMIFKWCEYECICNWWFCTGGRTSS